MAGKVGKQKFTYKGSILLYFRTLRQKNLAFLHKFWPDVPKRKKYTFPQEEFERKNKVLKKKKFFESFSDVQRKDFRLRENF